MNTQLIHIWIRWTIIQKNILMSVTGPWIIMTFCHSVGIGVLGTEVLISWDIMTECVIFFGQSLIWDDIFRQQLSLPHSRGKCPPHPFTVSLSLKLARVDKYKANASRRTSTVTLGLPYYIYTDLHHSIMLGSLLCKMHYAPLESYCRTHV